MTAYHETGHLITTYLSHPRDDVFKASIIPRKSSLGVVHPTSIEEWHGRDRETMFADIKICLAGYVAEKIRLLARVLPNPAVQNNYLYLFAAEGCRNTGESELDAFESIEVFERPLEDIPEMIRAGEIAHGLVIAAFAFMGLVRPVINVQRK